MSGDRFVVLGVAHARSGWFQRVAQWATGGRIPVEFLKCVSHAELRSRLEGTRRYSAAVLDASLPGLDRDVLDRVRSSGCAPLVVATGERGPDWQGLGAVAVLGPDFDHDDLIGALREHARPLTRVDQLPGALDATAPARPAKAPGLLVAVTGSGGTGASTVAIALAQGLAAARRSRRLQRIASGDARRTVLLADFALRADQAMLHDARDVVPGIQELAEAHRTTHLPPAEVLAMTFDVEARGYRLLLGLRRPRDWSAIRPRAFEAALAGLRGAADVVVADVDADVEGERETGSVDVEERHVMTRTVLRQADAVMVIGGPSMKGLHSLVQVAADVLDLGAPPERILPVVNHAPRAPRQRAPLARAVALLLAASPGGGRVAGPVFLPRRPVDEALRDGVALPGALAAPLVSALDAVLARAGNAHDAPGGAMSANQPERIAPGSLPFPLDAVAGDEPGDAGEAGGAVA